MKKPVLEFGLRPKSVTGFELLVLKCYVLVWLLVYKV